MRDILILVLSGQNLDPVFYSGGVSISHFDTVPTVIGVPWFKHRGCAVRRAHVQPENHH